MLIVSDQELLSISRDKLNHSIQELHYELGNPQQSHGFPFPYDKTVYHNPYNVHLGFEVLRLLAVKHILSNFLYALVVAVLSLFLDYIP